MTTKTEFPDDFMECVRFHGHLCPGLAIGYAAVKAAAPFLPAASSEDEEIVAVVENDSCAVDAVQVLLGCTFGKGNLVFRDWGKQVFTFFDRDNSRAVRVSFRGGALPGSDWRRALRNKMDAGEASEEDIRTWEELKKEAALKLVTADPSDWFDVRPVQEQPPPRAQVVETRRCDVCGEPTMVSRMEHSGDRLVCRECASKQTPVQ